MSKEDPVVLARRKKAAERLRSREEFGKPPLLAVGRSIIQAPGRLVVSLAQDIAGPDLLGAKGLVPKSEIAKDLLGSEPIRPMSKTIEEDIATGKKYGEMAGRKIGLMPGTGSAMGGIVFAPVMAGLKALDIDPMMGGAKKAGAKAVSKLPAYLSKAAPRFGEHIIEFANDFDRAVYIVFNKKKKSAAHDEYLKFLTDNGFSQEDIALHGDSIKKAIKDRIDTGEGVAVDSNKNLVVRMADRNPSPSLKGAEKGHVAVPESAPQSLMPDRNPIPLGANPVSVGKSKSQKTAAKNASAYLARQSTYPPIVSPPVEPVAKPVSKKPKANAKDLWETEYADREMDLSDRAAELTRKVETAKPTERKALLAEMVAINEESARMEAEFLSRSGVKEPQAPAISSDPLPRRKNTRNPNQQPSIQVSDSPSPQGGTLELFPQKAPATAGIPKPSPKDQGVDLSYNNNVAPVEAVVNPPSPPTVPTPPVIGEQSSRFAKRISEDPSVPEAAKPLYEAPYQPKTNKASIEAGIDLYTKQGHDATVAIALDRTRKESLNPDQLRATAEAIKGTKSPEEAAALVKAISYEATSEGQRIQILHSIYKEIAPETAMATAAKLIEDENLEREIAGGIMRGTPKTPLVPDPEQMKMIESTANALKELRGQKDALISRLRSLQSKDAAVRKKLEESISELDNTMNILGRKIQRDVEDVVPASFWAKAKKVRVMAMLGSVSRSGRDLLSNAANYVEEGLADNLGSLAMGAFGGDLPKTLVRSGRSVSDRLASVRKGVKQGLEDVQLAEYGKGTTIADKSFRARHSIIGTPVRKIEKMFGASMAVPDKMAWNLRFDDVFAALKKSDAGNAFTDSQLAEMASHEADRVTLVNDNVASGMLKYIQGGLNKIGFGKTRFGGKKEFGLGDMILPFVQVPGAIAARVGEYTAAVPVSVSKGLDMRKARREFEVNAKLGRFDPDLARFLHDFTSPLMGADIAKMEPGKVEMLRFGQEFLKARQDFYKSIGRAAVGTTLTGAGWMLGASGVISKKDTTVKGDRLEGEIKGQTGYVLNLSGLKRLISGDEPTEKPGDLMVNWDWLMPAMGPVAVGIAAQDAVEAGKEKKSITDSSKSSLQAISEGVGASMDVVANQPVFQGLQRMIGAASMYDYAKSTLASLPASFVPQLLKQLRTTLDEQNYDTWDDDVLRAAWNQAIVKVPGVSKFAPNLLPPTRKTTFGDDTKTFGEGSTLGGRLLRSFFVPARVTTSKEAKFEREMYSLMESQGVKDHIPDMQTMKRFTIGGMVVDLTAAERQKMQEVAGKEIKSVLEKMMAFKDYEKISDYDKQRYLAKKLREIGDGAKMIPVMRGFGIVLPADIDTGVLKQTGKDMRKLFGEKRFKALPLAKQREMVRGYMDSVVLPADDRMRSLKY